MNEISLTTICIKIPLSFFTILSNIYRYICTKHIGELLELLSANGGRFEINQLLFSNDTALPADLEEKFVVL